MDKDNRKLSDSGLKKKKEKDMHHGLLPAPWQLADNVITSCSNTMYTTKRQFYGLSALMFP